MAVTSDQENKCLRRTTLDWCIRNPVSWMLKTLKMELQWPLPQMRGRRPLWRYFSASWIPRCHWHLYKSFQVSGTHGWIRAKSKRKSIADASEQVWSNALASPMRTGICRPAQCWGPRAWGKTTIFSPSFLQSPRERHLSSWRSTVCTSRTHKFLPKGPFVLGSHILIFFYPSKPEVTHSIVLSL